MVFLFIRRVGTDEGQFYGMFRKAQTAMTYFEMMSIEPHTALIVEPNPCPGRRKMIILYRWNGEEWK